MSKTEKLFRAIVVLGAAITAPACEHDRCSKCVPDGAVATTDSPITDAGTDSQPAPTDAPVDVVLIL